MKLNIDWKYIIGIEIIGILVLVGGILSGGIVGGAVAGLGALIILISTIKHFTETALIGLFIGAVLGGVGVYYTGNYGNALMGMFSGGMFGYIIGGNIFWWYNTRNRSEVYEGFTFIQSKLEDRMAEIDRMIKDGEKFGINATPFKKELIHQKGLIENVRFNKKYVGSLKKATVSYNAINEKLDKFTDEIIQRLQLSRGMYKISGAKGGKDRTPYAGGSKWMLEKPSYDTEGNAAGMDIPKTDHAKEAGKKEGTDKERESTDLATYEGKRELAIVASDGYIEYIPPPKRREAPAYVRSALSGYNVKDQISSGLFSDIYEGIDSTGRNVSVNVPQFKQGVSFNQKTRDKFASRAGRWKDLGHENIIEVYESDIRTLPHIVTEPVTGGNLSRLMENHELSMEEAFHIMDKVLNGMSYAHGRGVVHRNINPENIFFTRDGAPKIGDWGIGKIMSSGIKGNETRNIYAYSAPEEFDRKEFGKVERQTDIFQLGIMFYEMLTGKNPFHDDMAVGTIGSILKKSPVAPSSINPNIPPEIDELILTALEKNKQNRWESADVMYDIIRSYIGN